MTQPAPTSLKKETEHIVDILNDCLMIIEDFNEDKQEHLLRKL